MALTQPDPGVLRKAQKGDERAFSLILRAYEVPVFNYVLRLVGDRSLAEDLTQEVFLRVFQGLPRFSLRSKFTTWLFQVTKNRVLDELRAVERRPRAVVALDGAQLVEDAVLRHLAQPGRELGAKREARQALEDAQEDLLGQVLGERAVADEAEHVVEDRDLVGPQNQGERALVSPLRLPKNPWIWLG